MAVSRRKNKAGLFKLKTVGNGKARRLLIQDGRFSNNVIEKALRVSRKQGFISLMSLWLLGIFRGLPIGL